MIERLRHHRATALLASAGLVFLFARGGAAWPLGFVALVPWLRVLDRDAGWGATLRDAWAMSALFTAAAFWWFGLAIGDFTGWGGAAGLAVLLLGAPLFQPQFIVAALARHGAGRHHGPVLRAAVMVAAWLATEWAVPRLLQDTLGAGLQPARWLRQAADLGGATGLTAALLAVNEAVSLALARRPGGLRAMARPAATALALPLLMTAYGAAVLASLPAPAGKPLRVGLVQSGIVDYERLRRERGTGAALSEILDTHFAMSWAAIERQHADAVLWSETVYPTPFGHPRSEAGAEFDRQVLDTIRAAGVPFVFGTYDVDAQGEYNAAAFVTPDQGLLGFYRKTRAFPITEHVPAWLDGPAFRRAFPWAGTWQPGSGARVFPLRLADGREIPVLPLICLDDVDARLSVDGARLGAQVILTMSNDAWFTAHPQGAAMHQATAAMRSVETRLPQFRVTTNGYSAVIDATGEVRAASRMGEQTLVVGDLPAHEPPRTLMVAWGDWVGRAAAIGLLAFVVSSLLRRVARRFRPAPGLVPAAAGLPARVAVLPVPARIVAGALRAASRLALLAMIATVATGDGWLQLNTLAQIRLFTLTVLVPEAVAWCVLRAFAARASIEEGRLVLERGARRRAVPLDALAGVRPWRLPVPGPGATLPLADGAGGPLHLLHADPAALAQALAAAGGPPLPSTGPSPASVYAQVRHAMRRGWLDRPLAKFGLFPLLLALPAFRLHEHIAYGSALGEYYTFGLKAWATTFALWWAAWAIGVVLCAAALRAVVEAGTVAGVLLRPGLATGARRVLERGAQLVLYLGLPAWLLWQVAGH